MGHQYVAGKSRSTHKPHNMKAEEITEIFVSIGWIGELRERPKFIRAVPFFDKGPGVGR